MLGHKMSGDKPFDNIREGLEAKAFHRKVMNKTNRKFGSFGSNFFLPLYCYYSVLVHYYGLIKLGKGLANKSLSWIIL